MTSQSETSFYRFITSSDHGSNPADIRIKLSDSETQNLNTGDWEVALKDFSYHVCEKDMSVAEPLEFIICAPKEFTHEYNAAAGWLVNQKICEIVYEYQTTDVKNLPNACVVRIYLDPYDRRKGFLSQPALSHYDLQSYLNTTNQILSNTPKSFTVNPTYFHTESSTSASISYQWHSQAYEGKVAILPIAGKLSRRMIGLPSDYDDPHMIGILTQAYEQAFASKATDYQMRHHIKHSGSSFFQKHGNIAVLCSLVDKTVGYGSKILRLIPNDNRVGGKLVTALFGNDAYYLKITSVSQMLQIRTVVTNGYRDMNLEYPVALTLHFRRKST